MSYQPTTQSYVAPSGPYQSNGYVPPTSTQSNYAAVTPAQQQQTQQSSPFNQHPQQQTQQSSPFNQHPQQLSQQSQQPNPYGQPQQQQPNPYGQPQQFNPYTAPTPFTQPPDQGPPKTYLNACSDSISDIFRKAFTQVYNYGISRNKPVMSVDEMFVALNMTMPPSKSKTTVGTSTQQPGQCAHQFQSNQNKGKFCPTAATAGSIYCATHAKKKASTAPTGTYAYNPAYPNTQISGYFPPVQTHQGMVTQYPAAGQPPSYPSNSYAQPAGLALPPLYQQGGQQFSTQAPGYPPLGSTPQYQSTQQPLPPLGQQPNQQPAQQPNQQNSQQPAQQSLPPLGQQPNQQPAPQNSQQPTQQSLPPPGQLPNQQPAQQSAPQNSQQPTQQSLPPLGQQPLPLPGQQPNQQPAPQNSQQPAQQSLPPLGQQPNQQPAQQSLPLPGQQPAPQNSQQPTQQSLPLPGQQPNQQPAPQNSQQPAQQSLPPLGQQSSATQYRQASLPSPGLRVPESQQLPQPPPQLFSQQSPQGWPTPSPQQTNSSEPANGKTFEFGKRNTVTNMNPDGSVDANNGYRIIHKENVNYCLGKKINDLFVAWEQLPEIERTAAIALGYCAPEKTTTKVELGVTSFTAPVSVPAAANSDIM